MVRRPPRSTLFLYTTLCRSGHDARAAERRGPQCLTVRSNALLERNVPPNEVAAQYEEEQDKGERGGAGNGHDALSPPARTNKIDGQSNDGYHGNARVLNDPSAKSPLRFVQVVPPVGANCDEYRFRPTKSPISVFRPICCIEERAKEHRRDEHDQWMQFRHRCVLTTELSGRPRCSCRGQTRPTMPHGPLQRVVSRHCSLLHLVTMSRF